MLLWEVVIEKPNGEEEGWFCTKEVAVQTFKEICDDMSGNRGFEEGETEASWFEDWYDCDKTYMYLKAGD